MARRTNTWRNATTVRRILTPKRFLRTPTYDPETANPPKYSNAIIHSDQLSIVFSRPRILSRTGFNCTGVCTCSNDAPTHNIQKWKMTKSKKCSNKRKSAANAASSLVTRKTERSAFISHRQEGELVSFFWGFSGTQPSAHPILGPKMAGSVMVTSQDLHVKNIE